MLECAPKTHILGISIMKFVANVDFNGGQLRPLDQSDVDSIVKLYQTQTLAGQSAAATKEHAQRMISLSVQMAATQRGLMWAIACDGVMQGMLSLYDWQPTSLKTLMRLDAMPTLSEELQVNALRSAIEFLSSKYHLRNFSFHCLPKGDEKVVGVLEKLGFTQQARLRDFRRISQTEYSDVLLYNYLLETPVSGEDT